MEIVLTHLNAMDEIFIRTRCNEYRFFVIDPSRCRGFLSGGLLASKPRDAFLAGAIFPKSDCIIESKKLETGARALFCMNGRHGVDRMITSPVTQLRICRHADDVGRGPALWNQSEDCNDAPRLTEQGSERFARIA
jgi:hypothetical protein